MNIAQVEEIQSALLRARDLATRYERRDPGFFDGVGGWVADLERLLEGAKLPVASTLASARAGLVSVRRGAAPRDVQHNGRLAGRKLRDAAAAEAMRRVDALVHEALAPRVRQLQEGADLAGQLAALAQQKGMLGAVDPRASHGDRLHQLWALLLRDSDTAGGATMLQARVGTFDALVVLDRALGPALP